jgi:signal transduction histidine kinase/ActR/RegA family two-component response regulator
MSGALDFLKGGGEMGARMRALDWSATPLGHPSGWPQSLKTIVRVMLDSRFAMWMMWGPVGTFFCNDAYLPTVGVKRDWVLGARADKVWEEIWPDIGPRIDHVFRNGEATFDEGLQLFLRRSGYDEETFHTFSYSPVYDDDDRIAGMLCVVAEDTTRVIAERRLRSLRELAAFSTREAASLDAAGAGLLQALESNRFDVPFAAVYALDAGSRTAHLVACNQALAAGRLPAFVDLTDAVGAMPALPMIAQALASGREQAVDNLGSAGLTILGPWQEPIEKAIVLPLGNDAQSRPTAVLVAGISTRRQFDPAYRDFLGLVAEQIASALADTRTRLDARQRADALTELDRAKNLFFGNVSHELRTPLTLMLGPVDDLLARGALAPDVAEPLRLVQRNGARLRKLVNSLLDFSRIEAGRVDARYEATDLAAFTADLAAVFRSAVEQAGVQLAVRCPPLAEPVFVDRDMWERVVLNLLSNALKHTFEGEIEVGLAIEGSQVHLGVRDTGVGIAADELPRIFERFHRVAGARARTQEGTGIGLALVQELVRLHGGRISAISTPGAGSCFTVSIPLGAAHLPPEHVRRAGGSAQTSPAAGSFVDDALRASAPDEADAAAPRDRLVAGGRRERVLVVDDNGDMRSYIAKLLRPYWEVTTAADGMQALAEIDAALPDLVITDMHMPVLDGRGLIQHIRTRKAAHALPVIVLSAQAGEEQRAAGLEQGADDYLVKPFVTRELLARVEVQLARARLRSQGADPALWGDAAP